VAYETIEGNRSLGGKETQLTGYPKGDLVMPMDYERYWLHQEKHEYTVGQNLWLVFRFILSTYSYIQLKCICINMFQVRGEELRRLKSQGKTRKTICSQ